MTSDARESGHPIIGISVHVEDQQYRCRSQYVTAVTRAGGTPVMLPPVKSRIPEYLALCDGILTSGGDDPIMEGFGLVTHPAAAPVAPQRQEFELAILDELQGKPHPLLAVCLGMQYFALHAGGTLDQHLPDSLATSGLHWGGREHMVEGILGKGPVHSHHRQAITHPGRLEVGAVSEDGLIEAVRDPDHPFRLGVQWHPERTACDGAGSFRCTRGRMLRYPSPGDGKPGAPESENQQPDLKCLHMELE